MKVANIWFETRVANGWLGTLMQSIASWLPMRIYHRSNNSSEPVSSDPPIVISYKYAACWPNGHRKNTKDSYHALYFCRISLSLSFGDRIVWREKTQKKTVALACDFRFLQVWEQLKPSLGDEHRACAYWICWKQIGFCWRSGGWWDNE